jgi:hypothetical protein
MTGCCEHDNEGSGSIKAGNFSVQLRSHKVFSEGPAPSSSLVCDISSAVPACERHYGSLCGSIPQQIPVRVICADITAARRTHNRTRVRWGRGVGGGGRASQLLRHFRQLAAVGGERRGHSAACRGRGLLRCGGGRVG